MPVRYTVRGWVPIRPGESVRRSVSICSIVSRGTGYGPCIVHVLALLRRFGSRLQPCLRGRDGPSERGVDRRSDVVVGGEPVQCFPVLSGQFVRDDTRLGYDP